MSEPEEITILSPDGEKYSYTELPAVPGLDSLSVIDPRSLDLPSENWAISRGPEESLVISEIIMPAGAEAPRVRKHVHVNVATGICTSYVMDRKISDVPASTKIDVEHCVEELHMMHVCVGGPPASKFPSGVHLNARVDSTGNWRHNSCKIVAAWTGIPCNACESLQYELSHLPSSSEQRKKNSNDTTSKGVIIGNLSHRKQCQITALRKRRASWYRKKRNAEREMKIIQSMILEISEEPDENAAVDEDDDDDE